MFVTDNWCQTVNRFFDYTFATNCIIPCNKRKTNIYKNNGLFYIRRNKKYLTTDSDNSE